MVNGLYVCVCVCGEMRRVGYCAVHRSSTGHICLNNNIEIISSVFVKSRNSDRISHRLQREREAEGRS